MSALNDMVSDKHSAGLLVNLFQPERDIPIQGSHSIVLEKKRRNPRRQQREVTMTANESNGGTEQPAAEQEAPAVTEQQAAPQPAEPVAEQPPAEQAAVSPAEPEAVPTSNDAPTP
jgi:hypothetical protein